MYVFTPHLGMLHYAFLDLYMPHFMSDFLESNNTVK